MDRGQAELASALVHVASAFGFVTNSIAFMTIRLNSDLHTSFGIICACLAANNSIVLLLNSLWYLMPDTELFMAGSLASQIVGTIGLTLWLLGNRFHLLISANRLIAIISPLTSRTYLTNRNTTIMACVALFSALVQCSPFIFVDDSWFCYDHKTMRWSFSPNEHGRFYQSYCCYLPVVIELTAILLLDAITIIHLRIAHKTTLSEVNSSDSRSMEIRLFKQSFSQSIPLLVDFISFAFITPLFSDDFSKFLSTTFVWHLEHGVDGLIIDVFHARLDLFRKKGKSHNSITPLSA